MKDTARTVLTEAGINVDTALKRFLDMRPRAAVDLPFEDIAGKIAVFVRGSPPTDRQAFAAAHAGRNRDGRGLRGGAVPNDRVCSVGIRAIRYQDSRGQIILRGAGRLTKAVFGSLRVTKIRVCLGVRGEDPAEAARAYGRLNAWLYPSLGVIDRFVYLDFDELRILPDFGSAEPTVADRVSFRLSARLLFIVAAALRVLYEFWREKVLDVFL